MTDPEGEDPMTEPAAADEPQPEPETPDEPAAPAEVVHLPDRTDEHRASAAIEAAAEAAIAMPGVAGRDEFLSLAAQARMLSLSGAAPEAVRSNPYIAFHVAMVGRDLGISPSAAVALIDVISTQKGPTLSLSPQLLNGQIRRLGLGSIVPVVRSEQKCIAVALAPHGVLDTRCRAGWPDHVDGCECRGILGDSEFTWHDAQLAGIAGPNCTPGVGREHHPPKSQTDTRCGCNQGYRTYPKRMMWWRAAGFAADDYFPEAGLGLYSPEELGAVVDVEGRPVDPATAELPPGYELTEQTRSTGEEPLDAETRQWLHDVIGGLDDETRAKVGEAWQTAIATKIDDLTAARGRQAAALLRGMVKRPETADQVAERVAAARADAAATAESSDAAPAEGTPQAQDQPESASETDPGAETADPTREPTAANEEPESTPQPPAGDLAAVPEEVIDLAISWVGRLKAAHVDRELARRQLPTEGDLPTRQRRLAERCSIEWGPLWVAHEAGEHGDSCKVEGCPIGDPPF